MGYPKALLPFGNDLFLTRILGLIESAGLGIPTVVLGRAADQISPYLSGRRAELRINTNPDQGQLSSIRIGLSSLDAGTEAAMIWPVDQPAVSHDLVRSLIELFLNSEALIAFPKHAGRRGHPAIFHRALFPEFMDAPLEKGPKDILLRHLRDTVELPTEEIAAIRDIDTPSDYEALTGESPRQAIARLFSK